MEYLKQKETRFDAHGHWNTVHDIRITLNDALSILECIAEKYPDAFTHDHDHKWRFGTAIPENLPANLQSPVKILMEIAEADP